MSCYRIYNTSRPIFIFIDEHTDLVKLSDTPFNRFEEKSHIYTPSKESYRVVYKILCANNNKVVSSRDIVDAITQVDPYERVGSETKPLSSFICDIRKPIAKKFDFLTSDEVNCIPENVDGDYILYAIEVDDNGDPVNQDDENKIVHQRRNQEQKKDAGTVDAVSDESSLRIFKPVAPPNRFNYRSEKTGFYGRADEIALLKKVCDDERTFCWVGICGEGGSGKSRLVFELCKTIEKNEKWDVFYPARAKNIIERIKTEISSSKRSLLICFDDAMTDINIISDFFDYYYDIPTEFSNKIRVVLIDREFDELPAFMPNSFQYCYSKDLSGFSLLKNGCLNLNELSDTSLLNIIQNFIELYYPENYPLKEENLSFLSDAINNSNIKTPLFALIMADGWCNGGNVRKWDRNTALCSLKEREYSRVRDLIWHETTKPSERNNLFSAFKFMLAITTFLDSIDIDNSNINNFIINNYNISTKDNTLLYILKRHGIIRDNKLVKVYPDLLNEYLCIDYINFLDSDTMVDMTELIFKISNETVFMPICELVDNYEDLLIAPSNMSVFQFMAEELTVGIGEAISKKCSEEALKEFDSIDNQALAIKWLEQNVPDYKTIVLEERKCFYSRFLNFRGSKPEIFYKAHKDYSDRSYDGDFVFNWRCGNGKITYADKSFYDGQWNKDEFNGVGTYQKSHLGIYKGDFLGGKPNGYGISKYKAGHVFEGTWKNAVWEGYGKLQLKDGTIYDGEFSHGIFNGIEIKQTDGNITKKQISNIQYDKAGLYFPDGTQILFDYDYL